MAALCPRHRVTVPSFFMGKYPVTQAQYATVMGHNPAEKEDVDRFVAPNKPVVAPLYPRYRRQLAADAAA